MTAGSRRRRVAVAVAGAFAALVVGLAAQRGAAPPPPSLDQSATTAEGTGAISGVVVDANGSPLDAAVVSINRIASRAAGPGGAPSNSREATDSKGRFIFTKLPAADYTVSATRLGYFDARSNRVVLGDGQWSSDTRLVLQKPSAISGVITDEHNDPVVGAYVRVLAQAMVSGLPQLAGGAITRTDDRGVYRIPGLSVGKYLVVVPSVQVSIPADATDMSLAGITPAEAAAGRPVPPRNDQLMSVDGKSLAWLGGYLPPPSGSRAMAYPITFYPAARTPRDAVVIELKGSDERSGIDLQLRPVPVVRVSGIVDAPPEAEPAGMMLRLMLAGAEGRANGSEVATALVGGDRTFAFVNVPSGDYTIVANRSLFEYQQRPVSLLAPTTSLPSPPGWQFSSSGSGTITSGSAGTEYSYRVARGAQTHSGRVPLSVGARDMTDVVVPLKRAVTLSGRVAYDFEKPVRGGGPPTYPVYAEPADGNVALGMPSGRLAQDDTFTVDGLQAGLYRLRFLGVARIKSITWDGRDYTDLPFDASAGRDITGVVVTMTDKVTKLTGYARDAQNQLASHGAVIAFPTDSALWTGYGFSPTRIQAGTVGSNGSFTMTSLGAGPYLVIAVDESLSTAWQDPKFLVAAAPLATKVTLDWGDTQSVDLMVRVVPGYGK